MADVYDPVQCGAHRTHAPVPGRRRLEEAVTRALGIAGLVVALATLTASSQDRTRTVDPCTIASTDQLRFVVASGIGRRLSSTYASGDERVTLANADVSAIDCPAPRVQVRADVRYERGTATRTSGGLRFASPLAAVVTYQGAPNAPIRADDIRSASACLTAVSLTALDLRNAPSWLDDAWRKAGLDRRVPNVICFDVTSLVYVHLKSGHTM